MIVVVYNTKLIAEKICLQLSQTLKDIFAILALYSMHFGFGPSENKPIVGF